jgi:hypothetical protein
MFALDTYLAQATGSLLEGSLKDHPQFAVCFRRGVGLMVGYIG